MGKRDISLRIKSTRQTRKITKAMYLISASKFQKAKVMLDNVRPYYNKIQVTMGDILKHSKEATSHYFEKMHEVKGDRKETIIIITGDKGLCGAYNHNVIKKAEEVLKKETANVMVVGEIGRKYFIDKGYNVDVEFLYTAQNPTTSAAGEITDLILNAYNMGLTDDVYVIYTEMQGLIQNVKTLKILPLDIENFIDESKITEEENKTEITEDENIKKSNEGLYDSDMIYDPSPTAVFDILVPEYIKGLIYSVLVQAFASENFSRMVAMDGATTNADKMISKLTLQYNRLRQASITQEISEIIAGASV